MKNNPERNRAKSKEWRENNRQRWNEIVRNSAFNRPLKKAIKELELALASGGGQTVIERRIDRLKKELK